MCNGRVAVAGVSNVRLVEVAVGVHALHGERGGATSDGAAHDVGDEALGGIEGGHVVEAPVEHLDVLAGRHAGSGQTDEGTGGVQADDAGDVDGGLVGGAGAVVDVDAELLRDVLDVVLVGETSDTGDVGDGTCKRVKESGRHQGRPS